MMTTILAAALVALTLTDVPLPPTVSAPDDLRAKMESMLQRSPAFRAQVERLAGHAVFVRIRRDVCIVGKPYRAFTDIRRTVDGPIIAMVVLGPVGDAAEWIAHELEHILEQVEGVRLDEQAARARGGVWKGGDGAFETERAIRAGRRVAEEVRAANRLAARTAARRSPLPIDPMARGDD